MPDHDFDLVVLGHETEGVLSAVAAGRAGARAAIALPPGRVLGGLLTEGGLAYVDRDARHLVPPAESRHDGIFGEFLARAGVSVVALEPGTGERTLAAMLSEAEVTVLSGSWSDPRTEEGRLRSVSVGGIDVSARFFLDATPDGDLVEALSEPFAFGFSEYGTGRMLGVSPVPLVRGVTPAEIVRTCERLAADPELVELQRRTFGERRFLPLERGADHVLVGPPHLALAFQRWRDARQLRPPVPFEADGFNVAVLGPELTSWNGLIYFESEPRTLLRWSRQGADDRASGMLRSPETRLGDRHDSHVGQGPVSETPGTSEARLCDRHDSHVGQRPVPEMHGSPETRLADRHDSHVGQRPASDIDASPFRAEVALFGRFLREGLGWSGAEAVCPPGLYVRQTRHALGTLHRLSLGDIARGSPVRTAGTFCYYPDFRGFRVTPTARPLVARVALDAGLLVGWRNVAMASRAGGYTPPAHSLCRLVQYNVTLGAALGVAAALATGDDLRAVPAEDIRTALARLGLLADDPAGLAETPGVAAALLEDPLVRQEAALASGSATPVS